MAWVLSDVSVLFKRKVLEESLWEKDVEVVW